MKCDEAENYMMKYMDGDITQEEANYLNEHLLHCYLCKENFLVYEQVQKELETMPLFEAPEGFEISVMTKIVQISENGYEIEYSLKHKVWGFIWGTFTVLFGTGTILAFYRQPIMDSLARNPYFSEKIAHLIPVSNQIAQQGEAIKTIAGETMAAVNTVLTNAASILLAVLTVICAIQCYLLYKRKKVSQVKNK